MNAYFLISSLTGSVLILASLFLLCKQRITLSQIAGNPGVTGLRVLRGPNGKLPSLTVTTEGHELKVVNLDDEREAEVAGDVPGAPAQYRAQAYLGGQQLAAKGPEFLQAVPVGGQAADILIQ